MAKKSSKFVVGAKMLKRRKAWNLLKKKDQEIINRDLLIKTLNSIHKAANRDQNESWVGFALELARGEFLTKAMLAYQHVAQVVEGRYNGQLEGRIYQIGKGPSMLIVYEIKAFGIRSMNPTFLGRLRERLWAEVSTRKAQEGPRPSRKKKRT